MFICNKLWLLYFGVRYQDTSTVIPVVFLLSTGSDPFEAFHCFANEMGKTDKLRFISLGQGQGPVAENMISLGAVTGDWVFLQVCTVNLHINEAFIQRMAHSV